MAKKFTFHFKTPEDSPGYLLFRLTMIWQRKIKKILDPMNLTHTQFLLLASLGWLSREQENITQVDIANLTDTDRMMVSKVLRTLEKKEFIARREHPTDTRAKVVELTKAGIEVLQKALIDVENMDVDFFSVLGEKLSAFNANFVRLIEENK